MSDRDPITGLPYPAGPVMRALYKSPVLLWRLGLGPAVGRLFMVLTTTGRVSGLPRRTAIEYHTYRGRRYVLSGWGERSQWYQNILADPLVTFQTAAGAESARARRISRDEELAEAYGFVEEHPTFRRWAELLGMHMSREEFVAQKDKIYLITFDPTDAPTPPPLEADLCWVWGVVAAVLIGFIGLRRRRPG